jgi:uncharacterized protein
MTLTNRTLVIMAKAVRVGAVKTRLAVNLSPQQAAELYACLLNDTIALARALRGAEIAIMCPEQDVEDLSRSVREAVPVVPQTGAGLARGLISVFAHFANSGQRVVAFNSDSPHLPVSVLENAFELLESRDLVVGPTHDGGYYLVGAKASHAALFEDDRMGTTSAFEALLARARMLRLEAGFTDPFYDIDVASDLNRLAAELELAPSRAPRTAAWLREWAGREAHFRTGAGSL